MRDARHSAEFRIPWDHNRIVVGIDRSAPSWDALCWAVGEAYHRRAELELLTVDRDDPAGAAESRLAQMVTEARRLEPSVRITGAVCRGAVVPALRRASRRSRMVVVGRRGRTGFTRLRASSTSRQIAEEATVPVAVVQGRAAGPGPIIVGIDGSPGSEAALGLALDEARLRRCMVVAVFAYSHLTHVSTTPGRPMPSDPQLVHASAVATLESTLTPWRAKFPDVDIRAAATATPAVPFLSDLSGHAHLLVVGAHGHDPTGPLGSVPDKLLHRARCPVLVVR